ncbi:MAG: Na+/H+ antiporter NhaC family protein [Lachnospiraceae bacterium]|nr:Na+/H+ antiporter NhaC family protein [Lachnospiraceae bacterium]
MYATFWALVPPIVAIALALITKEVYSSLFIGILVGGLFYSNFSFVGTLEHIFTDGMIAQLSDSYNVGILLFLVFLGIMVSLMNKAGGSAAFGEWASKHIKTRVGAQLATIALGCLIFIDDYFNCLTVGSVMRPVTDRHQVSRAKLAYLIDATAAPICIIAPISSWAAAVSAFAPEGTNGLVLFIRAIPYNYYALFTLVMMITLTVLKIEYGPMLKYEKNAKNGDIFTFPHTTDVEETKAAGANGKVVDLVLPIASLIICCVIGMIYSGGFFEGASFIDAFANSDASVGLVLGSFVALMITLVVYLLRGVMKFKDCMSCLTEGFKAMVPAIMILVLAWTLKSMTDSLGAADYVAGIVQGSAESLQNFLPAIIFLIAVGLSFATGTSWGTFGILIPICLNAFPLESGNSLSIICVSACMAGAVCGDHCSPISDTTIMSSAGAQCDHIAHVSTQMPYALSCAAISCVAYLVAGFARNVVASLVIGLIFLLLCMFILHFAQRNAERVD